jgi:hypothetical protein
MRRRNSRSQFKKQTNARTGIPTRKDRRPQIEASLAATERHFRERVNESESAVHEFRTLVFFRHTYHKPVAGAERQAAVSSINCSTDSSARERGRRSMRGFFACLMIIGLSCASAASASHRSSTSEASYRYSGCICHFGYGGDFCNEAVSCGSEGGRCIETCVLPTHGDQSARGY